MSSQPQSSARSSVARKVAYNAGFYSSAHVLVNFERTRQSLTPLQRCPALDALARRHAQQMAESQRVFASANSMDQLRADLQSPKAGENVFRGWSIRELHFSMMQNSSLVCTKNILSPSFQEFGVGTAVGKDDMLYVVQLFRGGAAAEERAQTINPMASYSARVNEKQRITNARSYLTRTRATRHLLNAPLLRSS